MLQTLLSLAGGAHPLRLVFYLTIGCIIFNSNLKRTEVEYVSQKYRERLAQLAEMLITPKLGELAIAETYTPVEYAELQRYCPDGGLPEA